MAFNIAADKKKHFMVGIPLGLVLQLVLSILPISHPLLATLLSIVVLSIICYGFEWISLVTGKGHADNLDAIAGILGGITGIGLYWGIYWIA